MGVNCNCSNSNIEQRNHQELTKKPSGLPINNGIMKNKKYVQIQQVDGEDMDSVNMVTEIDHEIDDENTYDNSNI